METRWAIRREVEFIVPLDELELADRDRVIAWIDSGVELCRLGKPATPPIHLVSYFVLVDGDHVLLVDHINAMLWLPTGGHVEPGERPQDTVLREVKEELGVEGEFLLERPVLLTCTETVGKTAGHTDVSLWYALKGDRSAALRFDDSEFLDAHWFHRSDLPYERSDPHLARFLEKLHTATAH